MSLVGLGKQTVQNTIRFDVIPLTAQIRELWQDFHASSQIIETISYVYRGYMTLRTA